MIESDLALELSAVKQYNTAVQIATQEKDNGRRDLLVKLLKDEEDHVDWLEAQLHPIKEVGYERYLSMQRVASKRSSYHSLATLLAYSGADESGLRAAGPGFEWSAARQLSRKTAAPRPSGRCDFARPE